MRATKKRIERVADAIKFMVPLGCNSPNLNGDYIAGWTPKGLAKVKWPKHFGKNEREVLRLIAKTAIKTVK